MSDTERRKRWMGLLAKAPVAEISKLWTALDISPEFECLRAPEVGGVMVRGRAGATGAPFNVGEMTVTRCSLRLACGAVGHGYVQGRDKNHARLVALIDGAMQTDLACRIEAGVLKPLQTMMEETRRVRSAKAAATKVDFFTMARGED